MGHEVITWWESRLSSASASRNHLTIFSDLSSTTHV